MPVALAIPMVVAEAVTGGWKTGLGGVECDGYKTVGLPLGLDRTGGGMNAPQADGVQQWPRAPVPLTYPSFPPQPH
jgi:hypothetical protein